MNEIRYNSKTPEYAWLSNFYQSPILYSNMSWPTAEHLYQASKSSYQKEADAIHACKTAWEAKAMGKQVTLRPDWDERKVSIMTRILKMKFDQNSVLKQKLIDTGEAKLIHEAPWDNFWGNGRYGKGLDVMSIILMELRTQYVEESK